MTKMSTFFEKHIKYFLIMPLAIFLIVFTIFPTIYTWYIAFHNTLMTNFGSAPFNGLDNFINTLNDKDFFRAIVFSLKFSAIATFFELVLGLLIAVFFNREISGKRYAMTFFLLPMMISPALVGIMFRLMLNEFVGMLAFYLEEIGLPGAYLLSPKYIFFTLIIIDIIQWTSFIFIILYAALQTVPHEINEAAIVDGANKLQIFRFITVPYIIPFIFISTFLRGIDAFKVFDMIQVMTGGGPGTLTTSASIYIYRMAFNTGNFGNAAAASIILLLVLSLPLGVILRKINREV